MSTDTKASNLSKEQQIELIQELRSYCLEISKLIPLFRYTVVDLGLQSKEGEAFSWFAPVLSIRNLLCVTELIYPEVKHWLTLAHFDQNKKVNDKTSGLIKVEYFYEENKNDVEQEYYADVHGVFLRQCTILIQSFLKTISPLNQNPMEMNSLVNISTQCLIIESKYLEELVNADFFSSSTLSVIDAKLDIESSLARERCAESTSIKSLKEFSIFEGTTNSYGNVIEKPGNNTISAKLPAPQNGKKNSKRGPKKSKERQDTEDALANGIVIPVSKLIVKYGVNESGTNGKKHGNIIKNWKKTIEDWFSVEIKETGNPSLDFFRVYQIEEESKTQVKRIIEIVQKPHLIT